METKDTTIAETILQQLGGRRFIAMTGSSNFIAGKNSLSMKLTRNKSGANYLRITLTSMDDYTMEFISIRGTNMNVKETSEGVYCDQLAFFFTRHTGMYTSL